MQGRLEFELKTDKAIQNILKDLPDYVNDWYLNLKASKKTASSCRDLVTKVRNFLSSIDKDVKNVKVEDITLSNVQRYFISIQTKLDKEGKRVYTSDSYQQTVWCCLNNFLGYLHKIKLLETNYMELIDKPKNRDLERINKNRILLTKEDFNRIMYVVENGEAKTEKAIAFQDHTRERDILIFLLFMTTGMRKTALSEINLSDIDMDNDLLFVVDKGNKTHTYTLPYKVTSALDDWLEVREEILDGEENDALFITKNKQRLSPYSIYDLVCKYCDYALGYHVSPHKLRSGFCSILYNETGNVEFVRRAVGHTNLATTQRYIVTSNKEKEEAANIMNSLLD